MEEGNAGTVAGDVDVDHEDDVAAAVRSTGGGTDGGRVEGVYGFNQLRLMWLRDLHSLPARGMSSPGGLTTLLPAKVTFKVVLTAGVKPAGV